MQQALDKLDEVLDILTADPLVYAMASNDPEDFSAEAQSTWFPRRSSREPFSTTGPASKYWRIYAASVSARRMADQLELTFQHLRKLSGVARIRLYVNNGYLYTSGRDSILQASAEAAELSKAFWAAEKACSRATLRIRK